MSLNRRNFYDFIIITTLADMHNLEVTRVTFKVS